MTSETKDLLKIVLLCLVCAIVLGFGLWYAATCS